MLFMSLRCLVILLTAISCCDLRAQNQLPIASVDSSGFQSTKLAKIEPMVQSAITNGDFPGCVICFGSRQQTAWLRAFGDRQVEPVQHKMTVDTVFDLASLTKPVATASSVMVLVDQGRLKLSDRVSDYLPKFGCRGKEAITVQHLLIHQSGLIPDNALSDYSDGPALAWLRLCELGLVCEVGTEFRYSDVNFIVLAKLVEKVSGDNINEFSKQAIFQPLGMQETAYLPAAFLRRRTAVTEQRDGVWLQGVVHDTRAHRLGGIAGHAGLFSTASDLAIYASMMLGRGTLSVDAATDTQPVTVAGDTVFSKAVMSETVWHQMTGAYEVSSGQRGLGWDKQTGYSSNKGNRLTESSFGHGGFTGTVLWIDPDNDLFFIFLSSRLHPDGKGKVNRLAGQILDVVVDAMDE